MCYEMCASPRARPGHLSRHGAGSGGPDEPGHDVERANPCPPAVYFSAYGQDPGLASHRDRATLELGRPGEFGRSGRGHSMARALRVAVQMDPMETINIDGDSSF